MKDEYPSAPVGDGASDSGERRIMSANAEDDQGRVADLARFAEGKRDLAQLEQLLEERRSEFDALTFLGVSASEEVHSRVLAWLLDPQGSHGVGDRFLRGFLRETTTTALAAALIGRRPRLRRGT